MTKLKLMGTAIVLSLSGAAFAAGASCCADMACCKEGAECCKGKDSKQADCCAHDKGGAQGEHAGHDMSSMKH